MPESEDNIMSKTLKLVIAALMASMACVATMVINPDTRYGWIY